MMTNDNVKKGAVTGFIWRLIQNAGTQVVSFVTSIIIARILAPDEYGLIAMITVFTSVAMVFINTGFSSAIVQRKTLTDVETSTVFFAGIGLSAILYVLLYILAPAIALFYEEPALIELLRVESIILIIASTYSVQQSLIIRELKFKKSFLAGLCGAIAHAVVGITLAQLGFGPWALVYSAIANSLVMSIVMWLISGWKPRMVFSIKALAGLFSFSSKMLAGGLLDTIFNNIRSLIIGKQYSTGDLAYYNRGYQFPSLIMTQVDGAMTTVLFASLSKFQDNWETSGVNALRRAMKSSLYVCLPFMAGLCAIARPMVSVLLTDKWLPSVEYIRLTAVICAMWPLSAKRHALNAKGKSGMSLVLNIIGKVITLVLLILTYKHSVRLMIISTIIASFICQIISAPIYSKTIQYRVIDQVRDTLPGIILSVTMGIIVYAVEFLSLPDIITLVIQIPLGVTVYIGLSVIFKVDSFTYLKDVIKGVFKKA